MVLLGDTLLWAYSLATVCHNVQVGFVLYHTRSVPDETDHVLSESVAYVDRPTDSAAHRPMTAM
jgi:hypothetical protein